MNFANFQLFREKALRERRELIDCAATNLYAALARLIPPVTPPPEHQVHRCHLADEWGQHFGIQPEIAGRALVSCGVRDSLTLLFRHYAGKDACLWLPADNYPIYGELARAARLKLQEFPTLPEPVWPDVAPASPVEILVVTNPLKPLGRWLTARDVVALIAWLAASPQRRLVLDTVYTFDTRFHPTTFQLLATGQAILLHSLTKGWLQPRLFGVALVPESDAVALSPMFRAHPPPQPNLARARELLARHADMPVAVSREISAARKRLIAVLPARFPTLPTEDAPGYLMPIMGHWSDLLKDTNVLCLPATVFGSPREDITILSSLSFIV
jgi:histidinol-phosphate/aromatic aminotransferase/cobyric acid decarboxylase-like protein